MRTKTEAIGGETIPGTVVTTGTTMTGAGVIEEERGRTGALPGNPANPRRGRVAIAVPYEPILC